MGVIGGWIYRGITGQGVNLYRGILEEYGVQTGLISIVVLMVVSSVLSMSIRQMRHLAEKPSDFFRLPVFIIVSTFFLMPIRVIGFFRMGHASGWGTRAGAYAGGAANDEMQGALDEVAEEAPIDALERQFRDGVDPGVDTLFDFGSATDETDEHGAVLVKSRKAALAAEADGATAPAPVAAVATATAPPRRRLNPKAGFPYLIGAAIIALEVFFIV
jgi:hypothetical protein